MVKSISIFEQIKKIGNSKGIILPLKPLAMLGLDIGDWVEIIITKVDIDKIEHIRHEIIFVDNDKEGKEKKKPK